MFMYIKSMHTLSWYNQCISSRDKIYPIGDTDSRVSNTTNYTQTHSINTIDISTEINNRVPLIYNNLSVVYSRNPFSPTIKDVTINPINSCIA